MLLSNHIVLLIIKHKFYIFEFEKYSFDLMRN